MIRNPGDPTHCLIPGENAKTNAPVGFYNWNMDPTQDCGIDVQTWKNGIKSPSWTLIPNGQNFEFKSMTTNGEKIVLSNGTVTTSPTSSTLFNLVLAGTQPGNGSYNCYIMDTSTNQFITFPTSFDSSNGNTYTESATPTTVYTFSPARFS